jgi:hypothetical protein
MCQNAAVIRPEESTILDRSQSTALNQGVCWFSFFVWHITLILMLMSDTERGTHLLDDED